MTFFYDLNQRMAKLAAKQDAKQISEDVKASAPKSQLAEALDERATGDYSAKKAAAGKDIGKPGKNFSKIAKSAGARYGSKAAGERVAGAVLNKLRHPKEDIENEGNAFTGALAKTPKGSKFKVGGKEFTDTSSLEEGHCPTCHCSPCKCESVDESALQAYLGNKKYGKEGMDALRKAGREHAGKSKMNQIRNRYDKMDEADMEEGNEFTGNLAKAKAQHKDEFEVDGKKYKVVEADPTGLGEQEMDEGFAEMDAWLASREKEKGTGRFDKKKISTGTVYTRKPETFDDPETDPEATGGAPKRVGRPKSAKPKDTERVTKGSHKYKMQGGKRIKKDNEAHGKMHEDGIPITDRGEYDDEAGMAKDSLHTIVRHAKELESALRSNENMPEWVQEKIGQIKGMMSSVTDYILSSHERDVEHETGKEGITLVPEKAVSVAQRRAAGIAHAAQKGEIPKSELRGASKEMAKMDKSELHKYAGTKEKGLPKHVKEEEKPDFLDLDKDGNKTEPMKQAAKQSKGKDKKEEVDETTTSGSVATATAAPKASKGMQFGKGVYESINTKIEGMIAESMNVTVNMSTDEQGQAQKSITVTATDEDADKLAELLKMAGVEQKQEVCPGCGSTNCGCGDEIVDENSPDWPTNTETLPAQPELRTYSGGLNGPKSTGQTTIPVIAGQRRRTSTMEENVELERSLFKLYDQYKAQ